LDSHNRGLADRAEDTVVDHDALLPSECEPGQGGSTVF